MDREMDIQLPRGPQETEGPDSNKADTKTKPNETKPKRKVPGLDDPYEHAPPKPDGDPWAILLKPELEADKVRCDAWKEEVQNLLIFAGLFSAVVTAFVIESYKFLRPDPNDAIISLLTQISNGPNSTSSSPLSASNSTSMITPFVQTPSSVRINVFWFLSLILSLTTVLVGTIALQWLREHQSYPGFSPKETLAILHMRSNSLKAWYVPQIFDMLPLLLQGALVLFLAGLIDFTFPLGTRLATPVACIIGLILLFLVATTALPAFQHIFLLSGLFSRDTVPTPCAFKSPQSQIFRRLVGFLLHFVSFVFPKVYLRKTRFRMLRNILPKDSNQRHLFPYIYTVWYRRTWPTFDFEWLSLRDAWHNGILDRDTDLYGHRTKWANDFPLSDIVHCLVKTTTEPKSAKHTDEYLVAACYCFQEISSSIWSPQALISGKSRVDRRNNYFEQLHQGPGYSQGCSISRLLIHGETYTYDNFPVNTYAYVEHYIRENRILFYQDQTCLFLDMLLGHHTSLGLDRYHLEIKSRMMKCLLKTTLKYLTPIPVSIYSCYYFQHVFHVSDIQSKHGITNPSVSADLLTTIFENVTSHANQEKLINPLYTHVSMPWVLELVANGIFTHLQSLVMASNQEPSDSDTSNQPYLGDTSVEYSLTFHLVAKHLDNEISSTEMATPSLLFYLSTILLQFLLFRLTKEHVTVPVDSDISFNKGLTVLLNTVARYKDHAASQINKSLEEKFSGIAFVRRQNSCGTWIVELTERFSDTWWTAFFRDYDDIGLHDIEKPPITSSSPPLDAVSSHPLAFSADKIQYLSNTALLSSPVVSPHILSESIPDIVNSFPLPSELGAATIPNVTSDNPPPGQVENYSTEAYAYPLSLSPAAVSGSICSDDPPGKPTSDFVIDIQPPT